MSINVRAFDGFSFDEAIEIFNSAKNYLRKSDLANFLINEIERIDEVLTINVRKTLVDEWRWPEKDDVNSAGEIDWNITTELNVIDYRDRRPDVDWVSRVDDDAIARMSIALILMHEIGHACQYMTSKTEFREHIRTLDNDVCLMIENINVNAIENTVALELISGGSIEGIRWDYRDTQ